MDITIRLPSIIHDAILVIAVALLAALSLAVLSPTQNLPQYVGDFRLSANPWGIALYQEGKHASYQFSAYNDAAIDASGSRTPVLTETAAHREQGPLPERVRAFTDLMLYRFGLLPVSHSVTDGRVRATLTADVTDNRVAITKTVTGSPLVSGVRALTAMTYGRDDIIFDDTTVYTEIPDRHATLLAAETGKERSVLDVTDRRVAVAGPSVTIVNPNVPGRLTMTANVGQRLFVDRASKRIEIEEHYENEPGKTWTTGVTLDVGARMADN